MKWKLLVGMGAGVAVGILAIGKSRTKSHEDVAGTSPEVVNSIPSEAENPVRLASVIEIDRFRPPAVEQESPSAAPAEAQTEQAEESIFDRPNEEVKPATQPATRKVRSAARSTKRPFHQMGASLLEIINEWPQERLIEIEGIGPVLAKKIIQGRPYENEDAFTSTKKLPPSAIRSLKRVA